MQASVTVEIGLCDIVFTLDELHIAMHHEDPFNIVNILEKTADNTDAGNIIKILFSGFDRHSIPVFTKLRRHAFR